MGFVFKPVCEIGLRHSNKHLLCKSKPYKPKTPRNRVRDIANREQYDIISIFPSLPARQKPRWQTPVLRRRRGEWISLHEETKKASKLFSQHSLVSFCWCGMGFVFKPVCEDGLRHSNKHFLYKSKSYKPEKPRNRVRDIANREQYENHSLSLAINFRYFEIVII